MLDAALVKAAQPRGRAYKMFDERGLFLFVAPSGLKSWRVKFRKGGKERLVVIGRYPDLSLNAARTHRDATKAQMDATDGAADAPEHSFASVAKRWHAHHHRNWSAAHADDVLASLERDIFPAIGDKLISTISAPELLRLLAAVEERGAQVTAARLRQRLSAIFGYARSHDLCDTDPASMLGRAMQANALIAPHPALTDIAACRTLIQACRSHAKRPEVALASEFLALTAVRWAAVRGARWEEIEGLDGQSPIWRVPAGRMKLARNKKDEARFDHLVPLSPAAVNILTEVRALKAGSSAQGLIFELASGVPLGEKALSNLYIRAGFRGMHVPHGWRSSFSTILNEALGEGWRSAIDRALAHAGKDKVEAAYNRSEMLERRRALFDRWATMLTGAA